MPGRALIWNNKSYSYSIPRPLVPAGRLETLLSENKSESVSHYVVLRRDMMVDIVELTSEKYMYMKNKWLVRGDVGVRVAINYRIQTGGISVADLEGGPSLPPFSPNVC
jgi:hypothetical protein